jgi:hypothetical protein
MYGLYTPVVLLQAICVYHAYRNNAEQRWYWIIIFFPLIGCIIYLIHNFNNRATIDTLTENVKEVVISSYRIEQLEKALRFSDNLKNRSNLAHAYSESSRYADAIKLYESCLQGFMADDPPIRMKLLMNCFLNGDYEKAVTLGANLESFKEFRNAEERVAYAWALFLVGNTSGAEDVFNDMNRSFTNYYHRLEYCKFLLRAEKKEFAEDTLKDLLEEFDQMQNIERRSKKNIMREAKQLYTTHFSPA